MAIVDVSQGHYQDSADLQDIARYMVPTPWVTVTNKQWYDDIMGGNPYEFGNGAVVPVPEGGQAGLIQASPNQMHAEMMKDKENQLIMLGARLITDVGGQAETESTTRIKYSSENSVLDNLASNASEAIEKCLYWCAEYEGVQGDIKFELNREFWDTKLSPQDISAQILLLDRGVKAMSDVRGTLRKSGEIEQSRTDEEIDGEAEVSGSGL